jgi:hypothetical protein
MLARETRCSRRHLQGELVQRPCHRHRRSEVAPIGCGEKRESGFGGPSVSPGGRQQTLLGFLVLGTPQASLECTPFSEASKVAQWIAEERRRGRPATSTLWLAVRRGGEGGAVGHRRHAVPGRGRATHARQRRNHRRGEFAEWFAITRCLNWVMSGWHARIEWKSMMCI